MNLFFITFLFDINKQCVCYPFRIREKTFLLFNLNNLILLMKQ